MSDQGFAIELSKRFLSELRTFGYKPQKAYLFGSFAKNQQNEYSDIDLAVWDSNFSGCMAVDYEGFKTLLIRFPRIELHTFNPADRDDPFISEIEKEGINLL